MEEVMYICYKVWDEITDPFPNIYSAAVWERIGNFIPYLTGYVIIYLCWG